MTATRFLSVTSDVIYGYSKNMREALCARRRQLKIHLWQLNLELAEFYGAPQNISLIERAQSASWRLIHR
jgi:hypothetical protein